MITNEATAPTEPKAKLTRYEHWQKALDFTATVVEELAFCEPEHIHELANITLDLSASYSPYRDYRYEHWEKALAFTKQIRDRLGLVEPQHIHDLGTILCELIRAYTSYDD